MLVAKISLLAPPIPIHDKLSGSSALFFLLCEFDSDFIFALANVKVFRDV